MGELDTFVFNRYDKAIGHYEFILNSKPNFYDAYLGMAYCFHKLRLFDSAITAVDRCLDIRSDVGMAYYIKGLSAQSLNQKVLACDSFQAAGKLGLTVAVDSLSSYCQNYHPTTSN